MSIKYISELERMKHYAENHNDVQMIEFINRVENFKSNLKKIDDPRNHFFSDPIERVEISQRNLDFLARIAFRHDETLDYVEKLEEQNKRYREVLKKISNVQHDEEFSPYAYMALEIMEWADKALEESK